ncbi:MAG: winged helix DNA-binding domain-containing protein, partial [Nocardioidaceae bacterium]|nr:winged helix DNA-binding domain-containing protein [Nocardioidaceae bacterium]
MSKVAAAWQDRLVQSIAVAERRARLARRHRLAPGHRAANVVEATRSVVCLHGTDPVTVYLSALARVDGMAMSDLDRALYVDRSLVKHLAMRRTLFV